MIVTCVEFNPKIAALAANTKRICQYIKSAAQEEGEVLVFPELALTGYSPRDLLLSRPFLKKVHAAIAEIVKCVGPGAVILGVPYCDPESSALFNAALILTEGKIKKYIKKSLLPNYDVFDEPRYFTPGVMGRGTNVVEIFGQRLLILICEDLRCLEESGKVPQEHFFLRQEYQNDPSAFAQETCDAIITIAASPYTQSKLEERLFSVRSLVQTKQCPLIYVNQCGANDELIFDGRSFGMDRHGEIIKMTAGFRECVLSFELTVEQGHGKLVPVLEKEETRRWWSWPHATSDVKTLSICDNGQENQDGQRWETLFRALVMGVADYAKKSHFTKALLGLSGGMDSALTLVIAAEALGAKNILALAMPSLYSSPASIEDAKTLVNRLGVALEIFPIVEPFEHMTNAFTLAGMPVNGGKLAKLTHENLQSRLRGLILMTYSNEQGRLLLATGNKSELAVGYCTLYGDTNGALAVIGDLFKTEVYALAHYLRDRYHEGIPKNILVKAPSAELSEKQKDSDTLPPYDILDPILRMVLLQGLHAEEIITKGYDAVIVGKVIALIQKSEYKRIQAPPVLKVSECAFGSGRRIPIVKA